MSLFALVHPTAGRAWMCTIRDFCRGGMLLSSDRSQPKLGNGTEQPRAEDPITVHFSVPQGNGQRHFRIAARIARVMDGGHAIGVLMPEGMEERAYDTLCEYAGIGQLALGKGAAGRADVPIDARDKRITEAAGQKVKAQLREMSERALPRIARAFLERADKDLLVRARDASSTTNQNLLFESMAELERSRRSIEESLVRRIVVQIDVVEEPDMVVARRRRQSFSGQSDQLSLVDTARFEEWLASAEVISKAEARSTQQLTDIRLRMGLVARAWGHKEVNPISPAAVITALDEAIEVISLPKGSRKVLYKSMQESVLPLLRNLYSSIDDWLAGSGLFPPLDQIVDKPPPPKPKPRTDAADAAAGAGGEAGGAAAAGGAPVAAAAAGPMVAGVAGVAAGAAGAVLPPGVAGAALAPGAVYPLGGGSGVGPSVVPGAGSPAAGNEQMSPEMLAGLAATVAGRGGWRTWRWAGWCQFRNRCCRAAGSRRRLWAGGLGRRCVSGGPRIAGP